MIPWMIRGTDHPRSRGVYEIKELHKATEDGSSPLARGLHHRQTIKSPSLRIIPARAGFTLAEIGDLKARKDHPRSRGVYPFSRPWIRVRVGSSPLARGLPGLPCAQYVMAGIIPARAGFT